MRICLTSDTHYPWTLTKITALASDYGYTEQFYDHLENFFKSLGEKIDALIFCGDFTWDLSTFPFAKDVLQKINPMWFFYPFVQLAFIRQWVNQDIPIIIVEGNHEFWFDWMKTPVEYPKDHLYLNVELLQLHLNQMKLSNEKIDEILEKLDDVFNYTRDYQNNIQFIGNNIQLLRDRGIRLGEYHFYGFPWYEKKSKSKSWSQIRYEILGKYKRYRDETVLPSDSKDVIILHHRNPPTVDFIQSLTHPEVSIKAFYYGHWHNMPDKMLDQYERNGVYKCVMPEKNNFKPLTIDL